MATEAEYHKKSRGGLCVAFCASGHRDTSFGSEAAAFFLYRSGKMGRRPVADLLQRVVVTVQQSDAAVLRAFALFYLFVGWYLSLSTATVYSHRFALFVFLNFIIIIVIVIYFICSGLDFTL